MSDCNLQFIYTVCKPLPLLYSSPAWRWLVAGSDHSSTPTTNVRFVPLLFWVLISDQLSVQSAAQARPSRMFPSKISCALLPLLALSVSAASNLVFKKIEVQMGAVGSDDDIRIKICSGATCCTTDKLSNLLGREWVAKKKETWDGGKLGNCSRVSFSDKLSSIDVTLFKNGKKEGPEVVNMNITGQIGKDKKAVTVFKCGSYKLSKTEKQKTAVCLDRNIQTTKSLPPPSVAQKKSVNVNVEKISVQIGDDGTDNDVSLQVFVQLFTI